jgi:DNA replication factor GINS
MNLDELQSIRDRERQSDTLQQLREDFYTEVGAFVQELRQERDAAAEAAENPFEAPDVNRLSDDINTAEDTVEAIYERRVGKLVKLSSFAAADMPIEDDGLTTEERALFEDLVASIEHNREQVFAVLDGEDPDLDAPIDASGDTDEGAPGGNPPEAPGQDTDEAAASDVADLMGSDATGPEAPTESAAEAGPERPAEEAAMATTPGEGEAPADSTGSDGADADTDGQTADGDRSEDAPPETAADAAHADESAVDRTTVRITSDVGEILGVDERSYELSSDDVVRLPAANADPLVERDAAERID